MSAKRPRSRKSHFSDDTLKSAVVLGHTAMKMAWEGDFDRGWANCPPLFYKGKWRSQKEIFFDNVSTWLPKLEAEALKRRLHLQ